MSMPAPFALTGATGFVGARVAALAGRPVRALARRPQPPQPGVEWVQGDLDDASALARLCAGAAAVIHVAGVVSAPDAAGFQAGNVRGTANMLAAASAAGVARFVHVSSLAAREPALSLYGASKADAETAVVASALDWVIVRPPGVYGPGDAEMLDLFRLARRGLGVAPGGAAARISLIHVDDLAAALLALAAAGPTRTVLEIDDGAPGAHSHGNYARAIGAAVGRRVRVLPVPAWLLHAAAALRLSPKLTADRARYLAHPDWVARGGNAALAGLWAPQRGLADGLADTVAGYRARGWL
jgi:nucleoside-diphosphate-sugar epimerase